MDNAELSSEMRACMSLCLECHAACTETARLVMEGNASHSEAEHLVALLDCAQMCLTHADFMARRSPHHARLAAVCADLCNASARLCDEHAESEAMKRCAQHCRKCEESCRRMASASNSSSTSSFSQSQSTAGGNLPQGTGAAPPPSSGGSGVPEQGGGAGATRFT